MLWSMSLRGTIRGRLGRHAVAYAHTSPGLVLHSNHVSLLKLPTYGISVSSPGLLISYPHGHLATLFIRLLQNCYPISSVLFTNPPSTSLCLPNNHLLLPFIPSVHLALPDIILIIILRSPLNHRPSECNVNPSPPRLSTFPLRYGM